jgi:hypothetical protein
MVLSENKKKAGKFCCANSCRNAPAPKKGGLCHKHYKRKRRQLDPIAVRYNDLSQSVKTRGKKVYFTLLEFRDWCAKTGYLSKGRRGFSATLDRRCNAHDYYLWNLRLLSHRANCRKGGGFNQCKHKFKNPNGIVYEILEEGEELPF